MSTIPSSAMPHAKAAPEGGAATAQTSETADDHGEAGRFTGQVSKLKEMARAHPKSAIAAGAVAATGVAAAVAIPMVRNSRSTDKGKGKSKSTS